MKTYTKKYVITKFHSYTKTYYPVSSYGVGVRPNLEIGAIVPNADLLSQACDIKEVRATLSMTVYFKISGSGEIRYVTANSATGAGSAASALGVSKEFDDNWGKHCWGHHDDDELIKDGSDPNDHLIVISSKIPSTDTTYEGITIQDIFTKANTDGILAAICQLDLILGHDLYVSFKELTFEVVYSVPNSVPRFDGEKWEVCSIYRFDGSDWKKCVMYGYDGTKWSLCSGG